MSVEEVTETDAHKKVSQRWRVAKRLYDICATNVQNDVPTLPQGVHGRLTRISKDVALLNAANHARWEKGAEHLRRRLLNRINDFSNSIQCYCSTVGSALRTQRVPGFRSFYNDLLCLERDFDVRYTERLRKIVVRTLPITLEGVELGRFDIVIDTRRVGRDGRAYVIYAVEPNPAEKDSSIIHPHVCGDELCEGEGHAIIRAATRECRMYDLADIINSILNTYNPGSPYVRLSDWKAPPCNTCGEPCVERDDDLEGPCSECARPHCDRCARARIYRCTDCEEVYCRTCRTRYSCVSCEDAICSRCARTCDSCNEYICSNCQYTCENCDNILCSGCYTGESGETESRCASCREEESTDDEGENEDDTEDEDDCDIIEDSVEHESDVYDFVRTEPTDSVQDDNITLNEE